MTSLFLVDHTFTIGNPLSTPSASFLMETHEG
jgi:hypothetical protein